MTDKFGMEIAAEIAHKIRQIDPNFSAQLFVEDAQKFTGGWAAQIADSLNEHLPLIIPKR